MTTAVELLTALLKAGAEVSIAGGRLQVKAPKQAPSGLKETFMSGQADLLALLKDGAKAGLSYVWSNTLDELVCFAVNAEAAVLAPEGPMVYTRDELQRLRGITSDGLKQIHMAKRLFGGRVINSPKPTSYEAKETA